MAQYEFRLPDVGEGIAEAEIVAWHVAVGDIVAEDQPLVDVMTDKATVEISSPVAGRIVSLHGTLGEPAAVGSTLVMFAMDGTDAPADDAPAEPVKAAPAPVEPPARAHAPAIAPAAGLKPLAAPAVRQRALDLGIRLQLVRGSGPGGRITHHDLDEFRAPVASAAPAHAERHGTEEIKILGLRRKIAQKMQESKRRIPHFAYIEEIDVTDLEALREHLNATRREGRPKLTLLPFLIRALVRVLPEFPQINATFDDEAGLVTRHAPVHVGIATQTSAGLVVPVIRHAEARDLWSLATEISRLAEAARDGSASREELSGSTVTITSLGPLGGLAHTPVINHPEVAIIGPNRIIERPIVRGGQIVIAKMMNLSSSFDHRVVDGYDAASFIRALKTLLEYPATLFID
jgi:2-oxoisovalerate dehydrogenase E2 component (dihydrolipoyl transacylase)